ncbi:MAG: hypothetical protein AB2385_11350 [Symbiobacterium sp.]|uniref:hypothetical protein n=1 Tax=Symbiobacterium sp. TaxID=1971213 RepID=UPI0034648BE4
MVKSNCLYYAEDGGYHWQALPVVADSVKQTQFVTRTQGWLLAEDGALLTTADGGHTWTAVNVYLVD